MESIKIEVIGNIAKITAKPDRITAGTVGLPVEFTFDSSWDNLCKTAVFLAGEMRMVDDSIENAAIVPWEVLQKPGFHLNVGVYGVDLEGNTAMTTTWANAGVIHKSANPNEDPLMNPTLPVWQKLLNMVGNLFGLKTNVKTDLVRAINEVYDKAESNSTNGMIMSNEKPTIWPVLWFNTSDD
jgi:hypothetical protein